MCGVSKWSVVLCIVMLGIFSLSSFQGCKDPEEFEPDQDTLVPPPEPPELLEPTDGFVYNVVIDPFNYSYDVLLEWTAVDGNELYEVELTTDTFPPVVVNSPTSSLIITFRDLHRLCEHHWRVRAGSIHWTNFTEWSDPRTFELRMRQDGPLLISPEHDTIISVDSLPIMVTLVWDTLQDEEFYVIEIYEHSVFYDQYIWSENSITIELDETGQYTWRVKAGSSLWALDSYWSSTWQFTVEYN
ncbi:MAG: hypothetical protein JSW02_02095 [candidate division WOR-3 bacterium]|nr:MAG: hypothetical protein JSW02_02095 [candidate division WOR-3 bacterium]